MSRSATEFKKDAAQEIDAFKQAYRLRNPGADVDKLTDADLLREAMNTIGKKGKLGEHVRCVVSVAMLTEGWDANTVTHILGVRPFRSQLLCEQVVGRGLRRRSYAVNEETGRFEPEYAEVYGVPFAFIPSDKPVPQADGSDAGGRGPRAAGPSGPRDPLPEAGRLQGRAARRASACRTSMTDSRLHLDQEAVALWVKNQGVVGAADEVDLEDIRNARPQRVAFAIAKTLITQRGVLRRDGGVEKPWLFPRLVAISRRWLDECVTTEPRHDHRLPAARHRHARTPPRRCSAQSSATRAAVQPLVMPIIRRFDPEGSTDEVRYLTRKVVMDPPPTKSHLNHVVLDGVRGNSWEEGLAQLLERDDRVRCLRQERAARVHDPLRPRGTHPRVRPGLPRSTRDRARRRRAHADHRGVRQPEVPGADRGQGRHGA